MLITCNLSKRQFNVKKVCDITKLPKNTVYYYTVYFENTSNFPYSGVQDIYINNSGFYATTVRNLKRETNVQ